MNSKLTIQERLKDLRVERKLTLGQLAEATGLSRAALGNYETNDFKDISPLSIVRLAQFYGVSTDYLLGLTEQKNHSDTTLAELHLSDTTIDLLKSGKINNRLLCEIMEHSGFLRLMTDIEIYIDRIASMQVSNLNAMVDIVRSEILSKHCQDENDLYVRTLEVAHIQEDEYFSHMVFDDLSPIIRDIREAHRADAMTAPANDFSVAEEIRKNLADVNNFQGSGQEKQLRALCNQLGIPYDKLTTEEFAGLISAIRKSKYLKNAHNQRGKVTLYQKHGPGKKKTRK